MQLECKGLREFVWFVPISEPTFTRYLIRLMNLVVIKAAEDIPSMFAFVLDAWSAERAHNVRMFALLTLEDADGHAKGLLGSSPKPDETSLDGDKHVQYLSYVFDLSCCSCRNVVCMI